MALQNDLTTGNVHRHIIRFAIPLILSTLFQALYNAVDMIFVGQFTTTAELSAVSVSGPIMNIMIMTINGLSIGVTVVLGTYAGHDDIDDIKKLSGTSIAFYILCALAVTVLGILFTPQILSLVRTPEEAIPYAVSYLRTIFAGILFMFGYNLIGAFQRGFGDSKSSLVFVIIAGLCNIVLDYIFIAVFHMGAFGAALATVIAQAVSLIMGIAYFHIKKHVISFHPKGIRISMPHLKLLLSKGLPAAAQQFLLNISLTTLSGIANGFGLAASAGYGIGIKIDSFALLPTDAMNMTMSAFTSQNIGAGKKERALEGVKESTKLSLVVAGCIALLVFFGGAAIASIFNTDPEVIAFASSYTKISCFSYLIYAVIYPRMGFIRGTGNAMVTLINVIASQYVFRIPLAILGAKLIGFPGIAFGVIGGPFFSMINYSRYVRSRKWDRY